MGHAAPRGFIPRLPPWTDGDHAIVATGGASTTTAPAVAPPADAREVLAFSRDGAVWTADADGSHPRSSTPPTGADGPWTVPTAWMPDRTVIATTNTGIGYSDYLEKVTPGGDRQRFDQGRGTPEPGDVRTGRSWLAVSPDGKSYATVTQHTKGCGQCWYKSVVGVYALTSEGEGEEAPQFTFTDLEVTRVAFSSESKSLYVLAASETGESGELTRISVDSPSTTNPRGLDPPRQLIGIDKAFGFAVGGRGELATIEESRLRIRDPDGSETAYGEASGVAFGRDGDTVYLVRTTSDGTPSIWMLKRSDPANARKILDNAGGVVVRPDFGR